MYNILDRHAGLVSPSRLTPLQQQIDQATRAFTESLCDLKPILILTSASAMNSALQISLFHSWTQAPLLMQKIGIPLLGFGAEITSYRMLHPLLALDHPSSWASDIMNFSILKGFGKFFHSSHSLLRLSSQTSALMCSHSLSQYFGMEEKTVNLSWQEALLTTIQYDLAGKLGEGLAHQSRWKSPYLRLLQNSHVAQKSISQTTHITQPLSLHNNETEALSPRTLIRRYYLGKSSEKLVPLHSYKNFEDFLNKFKQAIQEAPAETQAIVIEVDLHKAEDLLGNEFTDRKMKKALLQTAIEADKALEYYFRFRDESLFWILKDQGEWIYNHERPEEAEDLHDHLNTLRKQRHVFLPPVEMLYPKVNLTTALHKLRKRMNLTQEEAAERLGQRLGTNTSAGTISRYETNQREGISFPYLEALAFIYGVGIRELIYISNRSRFPEIPEHFWKTEHYPIYLENDADLGRMKYFMEQDPEKQTLGYLVYRLRKNPYRYFNGEVLGRRLGRMGHYGQILETNTHYPFLETLEKLSELFELDLGELVRHTNRTFFPKLDMELLFPDQNIYLSQNGIDDEKVALYAQHPESVGKHLFAFRKSLKGNVSIDDMPALFGHERQYWNSRELKVDAVRPDELADWLWIFKLMGKTYEDLKTFQKEVVEDAESPRLLIAEALGGASQDSLGNTTGLSRKTIGNFYAMTGASTALHHPESILDLQGGLPNLEGDKLYVKLRPDILDFFPELKDGNVLILNPELIAQAQTFDFRVALFHHRMDHQLEGPTLGAKVGMSGPSILSHEKTVQRVEDPRHLMAFSQVLGIDPKMLYLYFHPQVLALFQQSPSGETSPVRWTKAQYDDWMRGKERGRDECNKRRVLASILRKHRINSPEALAKKLNVTVEKAKRLLNDRLILYHDDILLLKKHFPEFPAWEFYVHFNHGALTYFLGSNADASAKLEKVEKLDWDAFLAQDFVGMIEDALSRRFQTRKEAGRHLPPRLVISRNLLKESVGETVWLDLTIARFASTLGLDRDTLFIYFNRNEIRPLIP